MAHFARIQDGTVTSVVRVESAELLDGDGVEQEAIGQQFLVSVFPDTSASDWVQTSYTASMRGKYAGIGDLWDGVNFITSAPLEP